MVAPSEGVEGSPDSEIARLDRSAGAGSKPLTEPRPGLSRLPVHARVVVDSSGGFVRNAAGLPREDGAIAALLLTVGKQVGEALGVGDARAFELTSPAKQSMVGVARPPGIWLSVVGQRQDTLRLLEGLRS